MTGKRIRRLLFILLFSGSGFCAGCAGRRAAETGTATPVPVVSGERPAVSPFYPFNRYTLPNGLTVLVKEVHAVPVVAVYFWVKTGSANEDPSIAGISHFFEHMYFKGTEKRKAGEMDRIIKELGGYNNAFTSMDYTGYYVVVPSGNFTVAFDILLDAIRNSVFALEEIERERNVIIEEINMKEDNPGSKLTLEFIKEIFKGTPYGSPIIGTIESLRRIRRDDFVSYLRDYYVPDNITVVVVGDVDEKEVMVLIEKSTRDFSADPKRKKRSREFVFNPQAEKREASFSRDVKQCYSMFGFPNYGLREREEVYVLDVASTILGGGRTSRLYQRLLEKEGIVTSIEAGIWALNFAGALMVETVCAPENLQRVHKEILEEIASMRKENVSEEELKRAKTMLASDFAFSNETSSAIASTLGRYETLTWAEEALEYVFRINRVTAEDIRKTMDKHCREDRYTLCTIIPAE